MDHTIKSVMRGKASSLVDPVRNTFNSNTARRTIQLAGDLYDAFAPITTKKSISGLLESTIKLATVVARAVEIDTETYFDGSEWTAPFSREFNKTIVDALGSCSKKSLATTTIGTVIVHADLDGRTVAWITSKASGFSTAKNVDQVHVETEHLERVRELIRQRLWAQYAESSIVLRRYQSTDRYSIDANFMFEVDTDTPPRHSGTAQNLAEYLKRAIDGGVSRSILLWGEPGTGKSSLARAVIDILRFRSLRLRVEDLSHLSNATLSDALDIFRPDAVIIDDLDRIEGSANHLFEMLSKLKGRVKLVFGTVNNQRRLPSALRRPGRFDERRHIKSLDSDVIRNVLGEKHAAYFETVKDWPIAYVEELVTRLKFEAPEEVEETIRELRECMIDLRKLSAKLDERAVERFENATDDELDDEALDDALSDADSSEV